ncbi:FAD binding domain-containing protein [Rothia sp. AR01]|uniref:FAD binding domain-containing protein n=1 Tax=Rothia santali TaxID=2949643 RepID=A0A9X2HCB8_9MICC|nr:FAD binding domain-containing protein [Rothia santali]MCP3426756.1 FAD binding domain-containing protein [Rothia santali]
MGSFQITVNGQPRVDDDVPVHLNLLDWLRGLGLTGAKEGCAEGECGACAILVARPDGRGGSRWTSINACLVPALALDGQEVVTSEGLGARPGPCSAGELHPVQREMAGRGGSQCGFCTPGFVCSMTAEYYRPERTPVPASEATPEHGENGFDLHALSGNLCRCTGYRPIKDAAYALGSPEEHDPLLRRQGTAAPPARRTEVRAGGADFVRPASLEELAERYAEQPGATLLAGSTDVGVEVNVRHTRPGTLLAIDRLEELRSLRFAADHVEIGAALTLSEAERSLAGRIPLLAQLFPQFASRLVRNSATLGGNLGTGSPIGDSAPVLLALDASLVLFSTRGERVVPLAEYFTGYRQTVREPGELLRAVRVPLPLAGTTAFYKVAKRRFDDISSISTAFAMQLEGDRVSSIRIGLGGVAATPLRARAAEEVLLGGPWTEEAAREASAAMTAESTPLDDHRASARYRTAMLEQSVLRFFAQHRPSEHPGANR